MARKADKKLSKLLEEHTGSGRCPMHAYMLENYEALSAKLNRPRPKWSGTAVALGKAGVVGINGQAPTARSVNSMWERIEREAAEAAEHRRKAPLKQQPNRPPKKELPWSATSAPIATAPPPVRAPPTAAPPMMARSLPPQQTMAPPVAAGSPELTDEAKEELASLQRDFERADAWAPPALGTWKR